MLEIPQKKELPIIADHRFRQDITSAKTADLIRSANWGWGTSGARVGVWSWGVAWRTGSTTFVTESSSGSAGLDQVNVIVTPNRAEIGALSEAFGAYVLDIQVFGEGVVLEVSVAPRNKLDDTIDTVLASTTVTCEGTEWADASIQIDNPYPGSEYAVSLRAKATGTLASIFQIQINETRHSNLAHDAGPELVAYGSEYVADKSDGQRVYFWDQDAEAVAGGVFYGTSGASAMARDAVSQGVHAVDFSGSEKMETELGVDLSAAGGIVGAVALRRRAGSGNATMRPVSKQNSWAHSMSVQASSSVVLGMRLAGFTKAASATPPANGDWYDLVWHWDRASGAIRIWINGAEGASGAANAPGDPLDDMASPFILGCTPANTAFWDGLIAMPAFISGEFTDREVADFRNFRRSIHGIY